MKTCPLMFDVCETIPLLQEDALHYRNGHEQSVANDYLSSSPMSYVNITSPCACVCIHPGFVCNWPAGSGDAWCCCKCHTRVHRDCRARQRGLGTRHHIPRDMYTWQFCFVLCGWIIRSYHQASHIKFDMDNISYFFSVLTYAIIYVLIH